jgi:hypothetical protein
LVFLMMALPVPTGGLIGAMLLWSSKRPGVWAVGLTLCMAAAFVTIWAFSGRSLFWRGPPWMAP